MNRHELTFQMESMGISPSKKMGQNFLVDDNFLNWMGREAKVEPGQKILEVGPGFGALTTRLLEGGAEVVAIEFDHKLCKWLDGHLVPKGLRLIEGDACRVNLVSIFGPDVPFRFISNLPYSCGCIVLAKLFDLQTPPTDMMVMLQKEVAQRLTAPADGEDYGSFSVRAQAHYAVEIIKSVPPDVFHPRPEIDSAIVRFKTRAQAPCHAERQTLSQLVRVAFSQRRKKMFKQVASIFGAEAIKKAMAGATVDPETRAEKVTVKQFVRMASLLTGSPAGQAVQASPAQVPREQTPQQ